LRPFLAHICALVALATTARPALAVDRVVSAPDDRIVATVPGSLRPLARAEADQGRADPATPIEGATLVFGRTPEQQEALEALIAAQQDPTSASYRKWLSPKQFGDRFGVSAADLAAVGAWLRSRGFAIAATSPSRTWISFSGTFGEVESAFHTEMHRYLLDGEWHFANSTDLSVPVALSGVVGGFRNLDDFRPRPRSILAPRPDFTSSVSGNHYLAPADFAVLYDLGPLYAAGLDGSGATIAVAGQTELDLGDVSTFRSVSGLPAGNVSATLVPGSGTPTASSGDLLEAALDVEWSGAAAPGAAILFVYTGNSSNYNVWDSLQYAIDQKLAPVISISYGNCEAAFGSANEQQARSLVLQAVSQGQTVVAASGDLGPVDCEPSSGTTAPNATLGLGVDVPAVIPEVTAMGGTEFAADVGSPATYWSPTNNAQNGSALSYIPEAVWNETAVLGWFAASGSGASKLFAKPTWQTGAGVPADGLRDVPDLALNAAVQHDGYLVCSQGSCVVGYRESAGGNLTVVGGTSAAAPTFAGILAIVNQATGGSLGNANPMLYALANSCSQAFHSTPSGNNDVPCMAGSTDCPSSGELGFAANGSTYNEATGLGSVDAFQLVQAWQGYATRTATLTAVAPASSNVGAGASLVVTATVAPSSGSGTLAGTVQFTADGNPLGSPVALAGGSATLSTTSLSLGSHSVAATYSGDCTHLPSTAAAAAVTIDGYTIALNPAILTVTRGASSVATVTVSAVGPFSGTVGLSCTAPQTVGLSCAIAPGEVTLAPGAATATAELTVFAGGKSASAVRPGGGKGRRGFHLAGLATLAAAAAFSASRRRGAGLLVVLALAGSVAAAAGCGSTASSSSTAVGYTVLVSGTGEGLSQSVSVAVNVQ